MKHVRNVVAAFAIAIFSCVPAFAEVCTASWYTSRHITANGGHVGYHTAAHKSHRFGQKLLVTNLGNGERAVVTVNDRGPFIAGRCIDVSPSARASLRMDGLARVSVEPIR